MNFISDYRRISDILEFNKTWKLLRSKNAPLIIAFLKNIFADEREVEYEHARASLKEFLEDIKNSLEPEDQKRSAKEYLREWSSVDKNWLHEQGNMLTMSDAAQKAISFCDQLETKIVSTSATHLEILLREVQNLYVQTSNDKKLRIREINNRIKELEEEKKLINNGQDTPLSEYQQKEKIKALYDLSRRLPNDFRRLEEETEEISRNLRIKIVQDASTKGHIISDILEEEAKQRLTDYGSAYEQFFALLCEEERCDKFKHQIKHILKLPIGDFLDKKQQQFVTSLIDILVKECNRVRKVRSRIDENLRSFLESAEFKENKRLSQLITELEQEALKLKEHDFNMFTKELNFQLEKAGIRVRSVTSLKDAIRSPTPTNTIDNIECHENASVIKSDILRQLDTVRLSDVRSRIRNVLGQASSMSIGRIISQSPLRYGLEEVVAFIRVAREMNHDEIFDDEEIVVKVQREGQEQYIKLKLPRIIITSQMARDSEPEQ